jgi:hypothetical protein
MRACLMRKDAEHLYASVAAFYTSRAERRDNAYDAVKDACVRAH